MVNKSGTIFVSPKKSISSESTQFKGAKTRKTSGKEIKPKSEQQSTDAVDRLEKIVEDENKILYEMSSVFPFQIFPDKIIVYSNKVVIVHKSLLTKNLFPILVTDIKTVAVHRGPFFASFSLEVGGYEQNPGNVTHLWPEHASRAESIIIGLLTAVRDRRMDISKVPFQKAKTVLRKLGEAKETIDEIT